MRTFKTLLFIVAASLLITACKKDKNKKSNTELLTAKAWVILKLEEKEGSGNWQDYFFLVEDCSKDDTWEFNTDKSLDLTEGNTACSGYSPNEIYDSTTWDFVDNESKLRIEDDVLLIEKLDESTLIISVQETSGGVTTYSKITMGH